MSENGNYTKPKAVHDETNKWGWEALRNGLLGLKKNQQQFSERVAEEGKKQEETAKIFSQGLDMYRQEAKESSGLRQLTETEKNAMLQALPFEEAPLPKNTETEELQVPIVEPTKGKESFLVKVQNVAKAFAKEVKAQESVYDYYRERSEPGYTEKIRLEKNAKRHAAAEKKQEKADARRAEEAEKVKAKAEKRSEALAAAAVMENIRGEDFSVAPVKIGVQKDNDTALKKNGKSPKPEKMVVTPKERGYFEAFEEELAKTAAMEKIEAKTQDVSVVEPEPENFEKLMAKITQRLREEAFSGPDGQYR